MPSKVREHNIFIVNNVAVSISKVHMITTPLFNSASITSSNYFIWWIPKRFRLRLGTSTISWSFLEEDNNLAGFFGGTLDTDLISRRFFAVLSLLSTGAIVVRRETDLTTLLLYVVPERGFVPANKWSSSSVKLQTVEPIVREGKVKDAKRL